MSNTPYEYDENDPALRAVKSEESAAIAKSDKMFDAAIDANKKKEDSLLGKIEANETELKKAQQAQSDLTIKEIEQNKEYAKKDYLKEQSGAYADWQKQSNAYGVDAEQKAASGMTNTGYSESSQVSMYNAYQNRVAVAREAFVRSDTEFKLSIAKARAQNSVALAEIASKALAESLQVSMNFASLNQNLISQKASNRNQIASTYASKWAAVLDQLYKEAALAEQKRQHDETLAFQREQFNWQKEKAAASSSGGGSGGSGSINKTSSDGGSGSVNKTSSSNKVVKPKDPLTEAAEREDGKADYPVDTASLVKCGLAGASAAKIESEINAGRLVERVVNGKLTYERAWASGSSFSIVGSSTKQSTSSTSTKYGINRKPR
jgi:hypothetical protein